MTTGRRPKDPENKCSGSSPAPRPRPGPPPCPRRPHPGEGLVRLQTRRTEDCRWKNRSPRQAQSDLDLPLIDDRRTDNACQLRADHTVWIAELRMVEGVEQLQAKLQRVAFPDHELPVRRNIEVYPA